MCVVVVEPLRDELPTAQLLTQVLALVKQTPVDNKDQEQREREARNQREERQRDERKQREEAKRKEETRRQEQEQERTRHELQKLKQENEALRLTVETNVDPEQMARRLEGITNCMRENGFLPPVQSQFEVAKQFIELTGFGQQHNQTGNACTL